jgi:3',5'-cyclic-AMP phosphodiesterase
MLIAQLTDFHVCTPGRAASRVVETTMLSERALRAVSTRAPLPDVVLLTGDLAESGLAEEYATLEEMLRRTVQVPAFAIPGNHDSRSGMIAHLPAHIRDETGFVQYAIEDFPVRLVMLETLVEGAAHGELCPDRLAWLDRTLAAKPDKPTMIAMHHPPFPCGIAQADRIALTSRNEFAALIAAHRQVQRIVCGHHHRAVTARVGDAVASIAPSVAHHLELDLRPEAPAAFVLEPPAYRLHR